MKKIFLITILSFLYTCYIAAEELEELNSYTDKGYKIIKEDTISKNDSFGFVKVFTLKKKQKIAICTLLFNARGLLKTRCVEP